MSKTFNYGGHTFCGQRLFAEDEDFREITKHMFSPVNDLACRWNWEQFFIAAEQVSDDNFDIFLMDGKFQVIPAHNGLFIYGNDSEQAYKLYLTGEKYFIELNNVHNTFANMLIPGIKQYITNHGAVVMLEGDFVPFVKSCKDGIVTEEVRRVYLDKEDSLCIETDADSYCVSGDNLYLMNLSVILEHINRCKVLQRI